MCRALYHSFISVTLAGFSTPPTVVAGDRENTENLTHIPTLVGEVVSTPKDTEQVVVFNWSMAAGYSVDDNPLPYLDNIQMLLGNAKDSADDISAQIRS